jgi:hypothetical protein
VDNSIPAPVSRRILSVLPWTVMPMTKQKKHPLTELSDAVAPARERHRELIDAACAWQAGHERPTDPDLFAMICAAVEDDRYGHHDVAATRWTRIGVAAVARCGIPNWCSTHRCLWPDGHLEAMWRWFDFLDQAGRMDPRSDPVAELRKPLVCCGGFDQHGRELPRGAPRQVECECHLPYRETVGLLNQLVWQCERFGEDPLEVLRRRIDEPAPLIFGDDGDQLDRYGPIGLLDDPRLFDPQLFDPRADPWADPAPGP